MQGVKLKGLENPADVASNVTTNTKQTLSEMGFDIDADAGVGQAQHYERCYIYVETASIRVGPGSPTTSLGFLYTPGDIFALESADEMRTFNFISAVVDTPATLHYIAGF